MTVDADKPETPLNTEIEVDKPVTPRRKRAPKAEPAEGAPEAAAVAPAAGEPVAPIKPPRKRRVAVAAEALGGSSEPLFPEMVSGEPAGPVATNTSTGVAGGPQDGPASDAAPPDGSGGQVRPAESQPAGDGSESQPSAADESGEGGESRSGRGRRRRKQRGERNQSADPGVSENFADDDDDDDDESAEAGRERPVPTDPAEVFAHVVSGEYDADGEEVDEPPPAHKRVLLPEPDAPKLQKVLAQSGIGSRRDMETLIQEGEVTVNGEPAHTGQRISFGDRITVRGKPIRVRIVPPPPRIIAYHKPVGEVVTHDDPQNRPTVFRRLPRLQQGKWQSVGRLDLNTEGLLLFTNSGELANQLMHPRFGVEREYAVRVLGKLDEMDKAQLLEGVNIEGQTASFRSIEDGGGEGANRWYRVVITEGRNREVRKLFDAVELTVSRLIRIRYGTVVLPRGLKRGVWVDLDPTDVRAIRQLAGGPRNEARQGQSGQPSQPGQGGGGGAGGGRTEERGRNKRRSGGDRGERGDRPQQPKGPQNSGPRQAPRQAREDSESAPDHDRNDDLDDDFDPARIPNPLEQTFDRRFVQGAKNSGNRGFGQGGGGFGPGGSSQARSAPRKQGAPREPDPLQTSVGYIGADAFHRKNRGGGGGGGSGGGSGGNRGGGGGSGGGNRGGGKRGR